MKEIFILGGPNGAGKTTAAEVLLPQELRLKFFLNADEIVRQLSPGDFDLTELRAGKLMLRRMRELIRDDQSFALRRAAQGNRIFALSGNADRWAGPSPCYFFGCHPRKSVSGE